MTSRVVGTDYTDGSLLPNYVNGRVLLAEDLATGQATLRRRDQRVGQAAGAGIVRGLWVTGTQTTLTVQDGLAMSAAGEPVVVPQATTLALTLTTPGAPPDHADFSCCTPESVDGTQTDLSTGILLLTARSACRLEGAAPTAAATGAGSACCTARWQSQGVEFRAIVLPVPETVAGTPLTASNRRNLVAHWCFGTERLAQFPVNPFGFGASWTGFDQLDASDLTPFDVPLAVFAWDGSAVTDIDNWSARRRVCNPNPAAAPWAIAVSDRRVADGEARFLQFQDQAENLVSQGKAANTIAARYFGLLPPVGFLPVANRQFAAMAELAVQQQRDLRAAQPEPAAQVRNDLAAQWAARPFAFIGAPASPVEPPDPAIDPVAFYQQLGALAKASVGYGYNPETFFRGLGQVGGFVDWELAEWALDQSWKRPPVATTTPDQPGRIPRLPFTYYYVLPNLLAAQQATVLERIAVRRQLGFVRSNLYVVFMANIRWASGTDAPAIPYPTNVFGQ